MIAIKKLQKPSKKSGFNLPQGETTEISGLVITNVKWKQGVYVDRFTQPRRKK